MSDEGTPPATFEPGPAYDVPAPVKRRTGPRVVIALATAVTLAAGGAVYALRSGGADGPELDRLVPSDTVAFASVTIKPSGSQASALRAILGRLPESNREALGGAIDGALGEAFSELGLDYASDVKPWVGDEVAVALPDLSPALFLGGVPPVVGLIEVRDEAAARSALQRAASSDDEVPLAFEIVEGVAYIAPSARAIDRLQEGAATPLSDDPAYSAARARLGDALATVWFDTTAVEIPVGILGAGEDPEDAKVKGSVAFRATDAGLELVGEQSAGKLAETRSGVPALLESASSGILGSLTVFDIGTSIEKALDGFRDSGLGAFVPFDPDDPFAELGLDLRRDVLSWMHGETSVVVGGLTPMGPEIGVLIEPTKPEAATRALTKLADALEERGVPVDRAGPGFDVDVFGMGLGARQAPGRVVLASPRRLAEELLVAPPDSLADDTVYRRAVGNDTSGTQMQLFVRLDRIRLLIEGLMPAEVRAEYDREVAPVLELFESFSMRASMSPDGSRFRALLALAQ